MTSSRTAGWARRIVAFVVALLLATVWGSVVQTQFNLQALSALDVAIPMQVRALTTAQDLVGFGPVYAAIVLAAWVPAFPVAAWLARIWPGARMPLYALAGGIGLIAAVRAIDAVAPMPVLIDATRSVAGLAAMAIGSVLGGVAFARWTRRRRRWR